MKREKRMKLLCIAMLCALIAMGWYEGRAERQVNAEAVTEGTKDKKGTETEGASEIRKIAITFDDDVIIGLSQEISGREAFSMI